MRILSICCTMLLITMCIIMQEQSVEAKPFIFKFFVPEAPARTSSSSSSSSSSASSSVSSGIDFSGILSTKLNFLTRLLQTGLGSNVSGGFNIGFKKLFVNTQSTSTRRPYTSTTAVTPDIEFKAESTTSSSTNGGFQSTTESSNFDKFSESNISAETIDHGKNGSGSKVTTHKSISDNSGSNDKNDYDSTTSKVTTDKNDYDYTTSKVITDGNNNNKNGDSSEGTNEDNSYDYTTSRITTYKPNTYKHSTPKTGYSFDLTANAMSENEISNEVMTVNNQYLPAY